MVTDLSKFSKSEIREQIKQERMVLNLEEISAKIRIRLEKNEPFKAAKRILSYFPLSGEINTFPLLETSQAEWFLPRCLPNHQLQFHCYKIGNVLEQGVFGLKEPLPQSPVYADVLKNDLVIVPGLGFDKNGNRIGYGKGYYDRFISKIRKASPDSGVLFVGLVPECFLFENLPTDPWDQKLDLIITESKACMISQARPPIS